MAPHLPYDDTTEHQRDAMTPVARQERREILGAIVESMKNFKGLTPDEIAMITGFEKARIHRRISELVEQSHIMPTDQRRPNRLGSPEIVYQPT